VEPSGMQRGLEDVLILIEGVHQRIPDAPTGMQPIYIGPAPPGSDATPASAATAPAGTEADRLRQQYQTLGQEQKHTFGDNPPGTKPADFTKLGNPGGAAPAPAAATNGAPAATPAVTTVPANSEAGKNPPATAGTPNAAPAVRKNPATPAAPATTEAGKNPPTIPGAPGVVRPATPPKSGGGSPSPAAGKKQDAPGGTATIPANPEAGKNPPTAQGAPGVVRPATPAKATTTTPDAGKNPPAVQGAPGAVRPATPAKGGSGGQAPAAGKKQDVPASAPKNPPDATRRSVPPAGVPPGGQLR
jgi:hypothetical protein